MTPTTTEKADPAVLQQRADAALHTLLFNSSLGDGPCSCQPRPLRLHIYGDKAVLLHEHDRLCSQMWKLSGVLAELGLELVVA